MNWEIIQSFCISVSVIGAAITYIYKAIVAARKPGDTIKGQFEDIGKKLDRDNKRIISLEEELKDLTKIQPMILRSLYVILQHMRTDNNTGEIAKQEAEINDYLFNR